MLTVEDLFTIEAINGIKIVAGEKGLKNEISIVNIMENPDAFDWLLPNELLLSTGYIFKDSEELQNRIIKELAEVGCAGLVIKTKRYFDKIPQNMIERANKYDLPLLELPYEYTLSRIISIINEKASGGYDLLNRKTLDVHNLFFRITLEGGGIEKISSMLASTINNPIILLDRDWNLLHYTEHPENKIPLEYCLDLIKNRQVFNKDFVESIPEKISRIKKSIKRIYQVENMEIKCRILPVAVSTEIYGYIVVWQTVRELTEFDYIILEQASTIMALERIKAKEIEEVKLKIRQDFFDDLLSGKITSNELLQSLCDLHGLNPNYMYYCIVVNAEPNKLDENEDVIIGKYKMESIVKKCVELVYDISYRANGEITCFHRNNRIIILVGQNSEKPPISISDSKLYAKKLHELFTKKITETTFLIGIGQQYKKINSLYKSFSEANEVIRLMQQINEKNEISHFEDYSVYYFIDSNIKVSALEEFFEKSLGKLFEHDKLHGTGYIATLENYFINNQNVSETAKAMFLHRNTLIYRIEKIKEILNTDLKHSEEMLRIQIALKIFRILYKGL
ncbi:PucR family transcriptional regulator [Schinkia azotoformans]|uniref:PucR family transcriptional regulator n=1 Tax=Schinkia azotoformans TaxID=1454 RepID=UPI002DBF6BC2|nr:PucR family transcriptional regulator ligand-binding domain-containing protein [Schinkia azotoformans]MEC1717300.1 PucR family transcriptional regulator ligand-binding domain-containing protein [Schinkia azotoformans]MEC1739320.1 PucR family transcriptional regulator ligand-binding domain-containing protein [Schinkia azotoformans]MEC1747662.1 PucR family transcriptional regulator ligand-binding domain-containing protein [Schinkia azotoformans]MEC1760189.1 PucR family transcriptional regulato